MADRREEVEVIVAGMRSRAHDIWWSFMLRGVLAGVLGVCALFWPSMTLSVLARLVGVFLLVDGLAGLVTAYRASARGSYFVPALAGIVIGIVLLFWPGGSLRTLLVIIGAWALLIGIGHVLTSRDATVDDADRGLIKAIGITAIVVGLVLVLWPGAGIVTVSWVVAAGAFVFAVLWITLALRLKRLQRRLAGPR